MKRTKLTAFAYVENIYKFLKSHPFRVSFGSVLFVLSAIVAFSVYWQLHYTAISMTDESNSEIEEYVSAGTEIEDETSLSYASASTAAEDENAGQTGEEMTASSADSESANSEGTNSEGVNREGADSESVNSESANSQAADSGNGTAAEENTGNENGIATASEEEGQIATVAEEVSTLESVTITDSLVTELDGKSYVITSNTGNSAMQAEVLDNGMSRVTIDSTSSASVSALTQWTFAAANDGYYIYSGSNYLKMSYSSSDTGVLSLTTDSTEATAFTVSAYTHTDGVTYLVISAEVESVTYYINAQNGDSGTKFVAYYNSPANTGDNSRLLLYSVETTSTSAEYKSVAEFYLWIRNGKDSSFPKVAGYSEYDNSSGSYFSSSGIEDALSYTDTDGTTYYLIPVQYFIDSLGSCGYTFDESNIASCPLIYAPNAKETLSNSNPTHVSTALYASYVQVDSTWYVRVTDTTGETIPRSNIYYTEYMLELYEDAYSTVVKTEYITDYIGIGSRQILIPVSYFSNYFLSSDIEEAYNENKLTESGTITICGTSYTTYTSGTYSFTYWSAYWQSSSTTNASYVKYNDTWYLLVQDTGTGYSLPVRNKIRYTGSVTRGAVLNLSNGNGTYNFTIYGSTEMRYTAALGDYADADGNVTINLPGDDDLGATFTVAANSSGSLATVTLGRESAYDYKLVGWYNIATDEYYDVSGGSVTAAIDLDDDNVFYADWIANSYDNVDTTDLSNVIETADTSSFVTIRMYDFSELFNLYSAGLVQNGLDSETWTDSGVFYSTPLLANDVNDLTELGQSFLFFDTSSPNANYTGRLSLAADRKAWNFFTGNGQYHSTYLNTAYAGLYDPDIIEMLYSTDNSTAGTLGSYYVGEANYLFSYDEDTGEYSYDAADNAAVYQQSDERFYVYNAPQTYGGDSTSSIFLPYNSYTSDSTYYTASNGKINYWFGVNIELNFYLPNDTGTILSTDGNTTTYGNQINGGDMTFNFKGDDDVWVFVDGELILDIGGIHSAIEGEINFSTGTVTLISADNKTTTKTISEVLDKNISAGTHTLTFYYMERGAGASNMQIRFSTVPEWKYLSSTAGTMTVTKEWDDDNDVNRPTSVVVGLFDRVATYSGDGSYTDEDGTVYTFDSDGYSYDDSSEKMVNAYISAGYVYVRVDTQTLTADNNWTYTWTLLDSTRSEYYQILELTTLANYTTSSSYEQITSYNTYWTVAGNDSLNGTVTYDDSSNTVSWTGILKDGLEVVLSDGSQYGEASTSGYPTTYSGNVIDVSGGSVTTTGVQFSQNATLDTTSQNYEYGVTTAVPASAVWTVEMTGGYDEFTIKGETVYVPTFYLKDSSGSYLSIVSTGNTSYGLQLVTDKSDATAFSYNALGELNTPSTPGLKIVINTDGDYAIVQGRQSSTNEKNVKIFVKSSVTIGSAYTITNTILPSVTLKKVDYTDTTKALSGVTFMMYQKDEDNQITSYYSFDSNNNVIVWNADMKELTTDDTEGTITYQYLPDGTYYLKETGAADGYNLLTEELWFTVSGGKITAVSDSDYISIDTTAASGLSIIIKNYPGRELPVTGAVFTARRYVFAGGIIAIAAGVLLFRRRRKSGNHYFSTYV